MTCKVWMQNSIVENAMIPKLIYKKHEKVDLFVPAIDTVSVHQNHHDLLVLAQSSSTDACMAIQTSKQEISCIYTCVPGFQGHTLKSQCQFGLWNRKVCEGINLYELKCFHSYTDVKTAIH